MNRTPVVLAAVAAFLIFAVLYVVIAASTVGLDGAQWTVAVVGGLVVAAVAAGVALAAGRRGGR